jgi:hypothetical protein
MELQGLLKAIVSTKTVTINLFNENDLLLITFGLPGYDCLDDFLLDDEITKFEVKNLYEFNITIDTSADGI